MESLHIPQETMEALSNTHPGYDSLFNHLGALIASYPPPFISIHDPNTPRLTTQALNALLQTLSDRTPTFLYARIDGIACFTSRLFYDTALNALARWQPRWEDGCANWSASGTGAEERYNESLDGFLHGLRAVKTSHVLAAKDEVRMVLVVGHAERLRENLPELLVPLTRLAELSQVSITTILVSSVRWEDIKPPLGASPDPYRIEVPTHSDEAFLATLEATFPSEPPAQDDPISSDTYAPALRPLHLHFCRALYSTLAPFTADPSELAYVAAARWPGFVQPVLEEAARQRQAALDAAAADPDGDGDAEDGAAAEGVLAPPSEETRVRLLRHFTPTFTAALEALYPRHTHAAAWAAAHPFGAPLDAAPPGGGAAVAGALPRTAKFALLAAYLASTNPAKSDVRMFGRVDDGSRRRKRKGGGTRKARLGSKAGQVKVPQRLLGPAPFPLDRLIAILGVLLEEYDSEARSGNDNSPYTFPGEETEMELQRVGVYGTISQLVSTRLLVRTSPLERLDGPPMFRSAVSYDTALGLARDLKVPLSELLWEAA